MQSILTILVPALALLEGLAEPLAVLQLSRYLPLRLLYSVDMLKLTAVCERKHWRFRWKSLDSYFLDWWLPMGISFHSHLVYDLAQRHVAVVESLYPNTSLCFIVFAQPSKSGTQRLFPNRVLCPVIILHDCIKRYLYIQVRLCSQSLLISRLRTWNN